MTIYVLRLLPLALCALCAPPHARSDDFAGRVPGGWHAATRAPAPAERDFADARPEPDLSVYAKYKRALARGLSGTRAADAGQRDGARLDTARGTTLKLPAGPNPDGLKVGLGRPLAGGWSVTGAYSRAFGTRRVAMGAAQ